MKSLILGCDNTRPYFEKHTTQWILVTDFPCTNTEQYFCKKFDKYVHHIIIELPVKQG